MNQMNVEDESLHVFFVMLAVSLMPAQYLLGSCDGIVAAATV